MGNPAPLKTLESPGFRQNYRFFSSSLFLMFPVYLFQPVEDWEWRAGGHKTGKKVNRGRPQKSPTQAGCNYG